MQSRHNTSLSDTLWTTLLTFSSSSTIVGAFLGGVTTKLLLNYMISNRVLQLAHLINIFSIAIMSLGAGLTGSYEAFIIGRLVVGYPLGVCYGERKFYLFQYVYLSLLITQYQQITYIQ